jgi:hypothetical protein
LQFKKKLIPSIMIIIDMYFGLDRHNITEMLLKVASNTTIQIKLLCSLPYVEVFLVLNCLRWEVVVCFVYICSIVHHHCLLFLFIIIKSKVVWFGLWCLTPLWRVDQVTRTNNTFYYEQMKIKFDFGFFIKKNSKGAKM